MLGKKIVSLQEAISTIQDGDVMLFGGVVDGRVPIAAMYEIVRQQRKNLVVLGVLSAGDFMAAAGCIGAFRGTYTHMGVFGKGPGTHRALARGDMVIDDMGHVDALLLIAAAAYGVSFVGSTYSLGTDILNPEHDRTEQLLKVVRNKDKIPPSKYAFVDNPFSTKKEKIVLIPAIRPDVSIIHVGMVGTEGTCRIEGTPGFDQFAAFAGDRVIVTAEEIVPEEYLRRDPNRNYVPCSQVDMIVHVPWGAHPTISHGYYDLDMEFLINYKQAAASEEGFARWADEWIFSIKEQSDYIDKLGAKKMQQLTAIKPFGFKPRIDLPRFLEMQGGDISG